MAAVSPHTPRRLAMALLTGTLLLGPIPGLAAQAGSCQPTPLSSRSTVAYAYIATPLNQGQTGVRALVDLDVQVKIARDGSARASGAIRIPADPAAAPLGPYSPLLIVAKTVVGVHCGDRDEDGKAGLTRLEGEFRDAAGEPVYVILTVLAQDVDANGVYAVALQAGEAAVTGEARFRIVRERAPHPHEHKHQRSR